MERTFSNINKILFICGDYNIDLMNHDSHYATDEFVNALCMSLFPSISRPSRITSHSATLIDNIFTNSIDQTNVSGLMISDITDHLPIFALYNDNYEKNYEFPKNTYKRVLTEKSIDALNCELAKQDWTKVLVENDVNRAYNTYLEIFCTLYNKHSPVRQYRWEEQILKCPWLTQGLLNACKKKNNLYKQFMIKKNKRI